MNFLSSPTYLSSLTFFPSLTFLLTPQSSSPSQSDFSLQSWCPSSLVLPSSTFTLLPSQSHSVCYRPFSLSKSATLPPRLSQSYSLSDYPSPTFLRPPCFDSRLPLRCRELHHEQQPAAFRELKVRVRVCACVCVFVCVCTL